jgi:hypothetical protein
MKENELPREVGQDAEDKPATEPPLEALQKTLHHIEAIKQSSVKNVDFSLRRSEVEG